MTLELLISSKNTIFKLTQYNFTDVLKSIQLFKYIKAIDKYVDFFAQERYKLFERFGKLEGENLEIPKDKLPEYNKELGKILSMPVNDMPEFSVTEDDIKDAAPPATTEMRLSVSDLILMEKLREAADERVS